MSRGKTLLRNAVFAATVAASLGFGSVQAFASPGDSVREKTPCQTWCRMRGYDDGAVVNGACGCWYW
jgi:hypothetical protein